MNLEVWFTYFITFDHQRFKATILAKESELGEAVTGIAWLELMSTDEENLNDTVIFKQSYEGKIPYLECD